MTLETQRVEWREGQYASYQPETEGGGMTSTANDPRCQFNERGAE